MVPRQSTGAEFDRELQTLLSGAALPDHRRAEFRELAVLHRFLRRGTVSHCHSLEDPGDFAKTEPGEALSVNGLAACLGIIAYSPVSRVAYGSHSVGEADGALRHMLDNEIPPEERSTLYVVTLGQTFGEPQGTHTFIASVFREVAIEYGLRPERCLVRAAFNHGPYRSLVAMDGLMIPPLGALFIYGEKEEDINSELLQIVRFRPAQTPNA